MVRHPFPCELRKQCDHATAILRSSDTVGTNSKVKSALQTIPPSLFRKCHGLAIATVAQVSILLGGMKGGAGVVIRHDQKTGEWGMPTGFGLVGGQIGFQFGIASIDLMFLLMTENAVKAFARGNVTLGGELGCALGPHGRTAEADIAILNPAPVLTYSFSRGLLFTMSFEGIGLVQRNDANEKFYGGQYTTLDVLYSNPGKLTPVDNGGKAAVNQLHEVLKLRAQGAETKGSKSGLSRSATTATTTNDKWNQPYGGGGGSASTVAALPPPRPAAAAAATSSYKSATSYGGYSASTSSPATGGYSYNKPATTSRYYNDDTSGTSSYGGTARTTTTGYSYNRSPTTSRYSNDATDAADSYTTSSYDQTPSTSQYYSSRYDDTANDDTTYSSRSAAATSYDRYATAGGEEEDDQEYDYETNKWVPKGSIPKEPEAAVSSTEDERKLSGTSPRPVIPKRPTKLVVLYSFIAEQEGDLEVKTGDIVILDKEDGEWYIGRNQRTGKTGMFPSSYAEKKN